MQTIELGRTGRQMGNATSEEDSIRMLDRYTEVGGSFLATKGSALPAWSPDLWASSRPGRSVTWGGPTCVPGAWNASGSCACATAGRCRSPSSSSTPTCARRPASTTPRSSAPNRPATCGSTTTRHWSRIHRSSKASTTTRPSGPATARWTDYRGPDADARLAALSEVAAELGVTNHQLVLAWLLHQSSPRVVPLIGPRTLPQLEDALPAVDLKLTGDQLTRLNEAGA